MVVLSCPVVLSYILSASNIQSIECFNWHCIVVYTCVHYKSHNCLIYSEAFSPSSSNCVSANSITPMYFSCSTLTFQMNPLTLLNCMHFLSILMLTLWSTHLCKGIFLVARFTCLANWRTFFVQRLKSHLGQLVFITLLSLASLFLFCSLALLQLVLWPGLM